MSVEHAEEVLPYLLHSLSFYHSLTPTFYFYLLPFSYSYPLLRKFSFLRCYMVDVGLVSLLTCGDARPPRHICRESINKAAPKIAASTRLQGVHTILSVPCAPQIGGKTGFLKSIIFTPI